MSKGDASGLLIKERYQIQTEVISKANTRLTNLKESMRGRNFVF